MLTLLRALLRGTAGAISHCVTHCLILLSLSRRQALRGVQHLPAPLHERPYAENPGATHPRQSLGMLSPPVCCVDSLHCVSGNHTADGGTSWIPSTAFRESTQFLGLASPYAPAVRVRSTLPTHHPIGRATALPRGATAPHPTSRQRNHRSGCRPPSWGYRPTLRQSPAELSVGLSPSLVGLPPHTPGIVGSPPSHPLHGSPLWVCALLSGVLLRVTSRVPVMCSLLLVRALSPSPPKVGLGER